jgi:hypothetical protein
MNSKNKILIRNNLDKKWNYIPQGQENFYIINTFYDLIEICEFDLKLTKVGKKFW